MAAGNFSWTSILATVSPCCIGALLATHHLNRLPGTGRLRRRRRVQAAGTLSCPLLLWVKNVGLFLDPSPSLDRLLPTAYLERWTPSRVQHIALEDHPPKFTHLLSPTYCCSSSAKHIASGISSRIACSVGIPNTESSRAHTVTLPSFQ